MSIYKNKVEMIMIADFQAKEHNTKYNVFLMNGGTPGFTYEMVLDSYFESRPEQRKNIVYTTEDFSAKKLNDADPIIIFGLKPNICDSENYIHINSNGQQLSKKFKHNKYKGPKYF